MTQSGCFGSGKLDYDQIDDAAEAAAAVADIVDVPAENAEPDPTTVATVQLAVVCETMRQRIRLLTWAVVILAIFVVAKELK